MKANDWPGLTAGAPLSVPWRTWLQNFPAWTAAADCGNGPRFDAIVIGSGYGGSVAALRLAEKGFKVLVLERGSEFLPGEFPNDFSLVPKFLRGNMPGHGTPLGRASGLVEFHLGEGLVGVTGNGLGGGSLINAGLLLEPDADVFAQPEWPAAIRLRDPSSPWPESLRAHFDRARTQLQGMRWSAGLPGNQPLRKTEGLGRLAARLKSRVDTPDLTIDPAKCKSCGDCAAGCNEPGAKKTLAATYLERAARHGAQLVTQAEVYRFMPARDAQCEPDRRGRAAGAQPAPGEAGWTVQVFSTEVQHQVLATAELLSDCTPSSTVRQLTAPLLFICAGTFGSTQLMQRSQAQSKGRLRFSATLGSRLSGNGDAISCLAGEREAVNAVGRGAAGHEAAVKKQRDGMVGPTITGSIDLRRRDWPLERRLLVQDGAIPRALSRVFSEVLSTASALEQLNRWWFRSAAAGDGVARDPLAAGERGAQHAQVLLTMGHDGSPGRIVWLEGLDRSAPYYPGAEELATYREQQKLFDRMGGLHVHSPLWRPVPESALKVLSGPKPPHTVTSVHPLGGCPMSDHPQDGVVDHLGRVWMRDPGAHRGEGIEPRQYANEPRTYRGLHVLDGSIVPTALGCNPLLTITALAERAMAQLDLGKPVPPPRGARPPGACIPTPRAPRVPRVLPSRDVKIAARLHEELTARKPDGLRTRGAFAGVLGEVAEARLTASFRSADFLETMESREHRLRTMVRLALGAPRVREGEKPKELSAKAQLVYEGGGWFEMLPANRTSSGGWLAGWAAAQSVLFVLALDAVLGSAGASLRDAWLLAGGGWNDPGMRTAAWAALLAFGLSLAGFLVALLLPFPRTVLTWWLVRGLRDARERRRRGESLWTFMRLGFVLALIRQLVHATEKRVMRYGIRLRLRPEQGDADAVARAPRRITLRARKVVVFRASIPELLRWVRHCLSREGGWNPPLRRSFWEQVMDADTTLISGRCGPTLARGWLRMGFDNLIGAGRSPALRDQPPHVELGQRGDSSTGLLALGAFPLLFARFALKTRLLDFRLPGYSEQPVVDNAPDDELALRTKGGRVMPEVVWLTVPRGTSSSDRGEESPQALRLPLWRYRRRDAQGRPASPPCEHGQWLGQRVTKVKSVLLLHAFGQSGLSFTFHGADEETGAPRSNLAEAFYDAGFEVWILETRMSTRSGYAEQPCSVDQIAAHDIPVAVNRILRLLRKELGSAVPRGVPLQIGAFGQCIGAAALWMALLSGRLSYRRARGLPDGADVEPQLSKISRAMFSQVHPWVVGSRATQAKTWMPTLLAAAFNRASIPFGVRGAQSFGLTVLDRFLASLPAGPGEEQQVDGHEDAAATCRRIRYIEAPLFRRENLDTRTYAAMNRLFGNANLRLFAHARRFVEHERLVDEDGVHRYVTDEDIRRHLAFPIQLLHGEKNELFHLESAYRSFSALATRHARWRSAELGNKDGPLVVAGYGHLDVLIGKNAPVDVFPRVLGFFTAPDPVVDPVDTIARGWVPRPPRIGPFLGWTRVDGSRLPVLRLSFFVDDRQRGLKPGWMPEVRVRARRGDGAPWVTVSSDLVVARLYEPRAVEPARRGSTLRQGPVIDTVVWLDLIWDKRLEGCTQLQVLTLSLVSSLAKKPDMFITANPADEDISSWIARNSGPQVAGAPLMQPVSPRDRLDFSRALVTVPQRSLETLPPSCPVDFAAACCRHPGLGLDMGRIDHAVRQLVAEHGNDPLCFNMLLGDQIYADATAGLVDPVSPLERYYERHETAFGRPDMRRLLASVPTYMTPDDHEWTNSYPSGAPLAIEHWPDWGDGRGFALRQDRAFHTAATALTAFQRVQTPAYRPGERPASSYAFSHGCVRVFVLDTRYYRKRNSASILGCSQWKRLIRWLAEPQAAGCLNVVASGSVVLPGLVPDSDPANPGVTDTWQFAPAQRRMLLRLLMREVPGRFLLLSGDYHVSAAVAIRQHGRTVGAAIIAPPLYAPLPYVNTPPEAVFLGEVLNVGAGGPLCMEAAAGGEVLRGSGFIRIHAAAAAQGLRIEFKRELTVWETGGHECRSGSIVLPPPLSAGALAELPDADAGLCQRVDGLRAVG